MKLIHCADLHLDSRMESGLSSEKAQERRLELLRTFTRMVEQAEEFLRQRGFSQVRVRVHGNLARLEVSPEEISRLVSDKNRRRVIQQIKNIGFSYVTVDLDGYRTGSMNESLGAAMK